MRISIDRAALAHALTAVSKVVESRNTIPILSNVLLSVDSGRLTIRGTDLDMEASASIAVLDASDGETTVDAKLLTDIVKKATGDVSLELDGDVLTVKSGRSRYRLQTLPAGDYPTLDAGTFDVEFDVDLAALVAPTQFAISTEETRHYLNGVYLHPTDAGITAVATDGHRLARHVGPQTGAAYGVILPRKLVGLLPKGNVHVSLSERKVRIATDDAVITSKLIDGTFPDYQRVIPMSNPHRLAADRDALLAAVERVTVVSSERGRAVKLAATDGRLVLSVEDKAQEELDVEFEWPATTKDATVDGQPNDPFTIGFNGQYLQDVLRTFAPGIVTFWLNDAGSPTRLTGTVEGLDMVIMPMRVN